MKNGIFPQGYTTPKKISHAAFYMFWFILIKITRKLMQNIYGIDTGIASFN